MKSSEEFKKSLPKSNDWVKPSTIVNSNYSNQEDLITLDNTVGSIDNLISSREDGFDCTDSFENIQDGKTIVDHINECIVDVGIKHNLLTSNDFSLVNSINEVHYQNYAESRLEDLIADYVSNRRGDFIESGLTLTHKTTTTSTTTYPESYWATVYTPVFKYSGSGWHRRYVYSYTVKSMKLVTPDPIITTTKTLKFHLSPGVCFIGGYKVNIKSVSDLEIPYILNDIDKPILDSIYLVSKPYFDIVNELYWDETQTYNKGESVFFEGKEYIALTNVAPNGTDPSINLTNWDFVEFVNDNLMDVRYNFITYVHGETYTDESGSYRFNTTAAPKNSILLAKVMRENGKQPVVYNGLATQSYKMRDIAALQDKIYDLFENIGAVQGAIEFNNSSDVSKSRNMYTESFFNDMNRDITLEEATGKYSALSLNGTLTAPVFWADYIVDLPNEINQIDAKSTAVVLSQLNWTGSTVINEFSPVMPSIVLFDLDDIEFVATIKKDIVNTNNVMVNEGFGNAFVQAITTSEVKTGEQLTRLPQNNQYRIPVFSSSFGSSIFGPLIRLSHRFNSVSTNYEFARTIKLPNRTFNPNETVDIFIGDILLKTTTSDASGSINVQIFFDNRFSNSNYKVVVKGRTSKAEAWSTIKIYAMLKTEFFDKTVTTTRTWYNSDPLAQTFSIDKSCFIKAIDVIFDLKSPTGAAYPLGSTFLSPSPIVFALAETTAGFPDQEKVLYAKTIPIGTSMSNQYWYTIEFDNAIFVEKDKSYSMFFVTEQKSSKRFIDVLNFESYAGSVMTMRTAELGQKQLHYPYQKIMEQPLISGMLLNSSNSATWTPIQTKDLTFRVHECLFNPSKNITGDTIVVDSQITDITYISEEIVPEGTKVTGSLNIKYDDDTISTANLVEGMILQNNTNKIVKEIIPTFSLVTEDDTVTPTLLNKPKVKLGRVIDESVFVTTNIDFNLGDDVITKDIQVLLNCDVFWDPTKIEIWYNNNEIIEDNNWTLIPNYEMGDLEKEKIYKANGVQLSSNFRVKVILKVDMNSPQDRIAISNLRVFAF